MEEICLTLAQNHDLFEAPPRDREKVCSPGYIFVQLGASIPPIAAVTLLVFQDFQTLAPHLAQSEMDIPSASPFRSRGGAGEAVGKI
jgi:hypothetical protein